MFPTIFWLKRSTDFTTFLVLPKKLLEDCVIIYWLWVKTYCIILESVVFSLINEILMLNLLNRGYFRFLLSCLWLVVIWMLTGEKRRMSGLWLSTFSYPLCRWSKYVWAFGCHFVCFPLSDAPSLSSKWELGLEMSGEIVWTWWWAHIWTHWFNTNSFSNDWS